jgi:hypothetical protein
MKNFISITMLLILAASAHAAVELCYDQLGTMVTVKYFVTGPNSVRSFALDLVVSAGTISAVTCSNSSYYIYPGQIVIQSGSIADANTCVCSAAKFPGTTQPGIGSSAVTVEMASLYTGTNKPASSGTLFSFTISNSAATVTLATNTPRGGVVMERAEENPSLVICPPRPECFPSGYTSYNDWKTMGKPDCWCGTNTYFMTTVPPVPWPYQCDGDADNKTQELSGKYRVYTNDYWKVKSNWKKKISDPTLDPCADFDHKSQELSGKYRVYTNDYWKLKSNWKKKGSQLPGNCPRGI